MQHLIENIETSKWGGKLKQQAKQALATVESRLEGAFDMSNLISPLPASNLAPHSLVASHPPATLTEEEDSPSKTDPLEMEIEQLRSTINRLQLENEQLNQRLLDHRSAIKTQEDKLARMNKEWQVRLDESKATIVEQQRTIKDKDELINQLQAKLDHKQSEKRDSIDESRTIEGRRGSQMQKSYWEEQRRVFVSRINELSEENQRLRSGQLQIKDDDGAYQSALRVIAGQKEEIALLKSDLEESRALYKEQLAVFKEQLMPTR